MSHASELLQCIIGGKPWPKAPSTPVLDPICFARACQNEVERDFVKQVSAHVDCDYEDAQQALISLGPNVLDLVNSVSGRAVLGHALMGPGSSVLRTTLQ